MAYAFKLQDPGEGIQEAEVLEVLVSEGDRVSEGDNVLVAETDKAAVEIPSPVEGEIEEIKISEGDIVEVGDTLMTINQGGGAKEDSSANATEDSDDDDNSGEGRNGPAENTRSQSTTSAASSQEEETTSEDSGKSKPESADAERKSGERAKTERETSRGKADGHDAASGKEETETSDAKKNEGSVRTTPYVRGLAKELNVDLQDTPASGEGGRILEKDVRSKAESGSSASSGRSGSMQKEVEAAPDDSRFVKLRSVRRTVAKRMERAWKEIPHAVHYETIDITKLERLRGRLSPEVEARGGKLSVTSFLMKALAEALIEHPQFNAAFDRDNYTIEKKRQINIGVALDTENGLLVPVIRDADRKSIEDFATELPSLAKSLREEGRAEGDVLKGGTFTLTNVGMIGGTSFAPIINPPQVAIFGAARAELRQVVRGELNNNSTEIALVLPVCVAFDHRVIDGANAARFMNTLKALLTDPGRLALRS